MRIVREEPFDEVAHAWLKAEWAKHSCHREFPQYQDLISNPDFDNPQQNDIRLQLLTRKRGDILPQIPGDTRWYLASFDLEDSDKLYHITSGDWLPISSNTYHLPQTVRNAESEFAHASWIRAIYETLPNQEIDTRPIVVAAKLEGPASIIEGNHRAAALLRHDLANPSGRLLQELHIGISPNMDQYTWHIEHWRSKHLIQPRSST